MAFGVIGMLKDSNELNPIKTKASQFNDSKDHPLLLAQW